jgi:hypothetical protein
VVPLTARIHSNLDFEKGQSATNPEELIGAAHTGACNLAPDDMMEYGRVLPPPGQEQAWFEALPPELQRHLASTGTAER